MRSLCFMAGELGGNWEVTLLGQALSLGCLVRLWYHLTTTTPNLTNFIMVSHTNYLVSTEDSFKLIKLYCHWIFIYLLLLVWDVIHMTVRVTMKAIFLWSEVVKAKYFFLEMSSKCIKMWYFPKVSQLRVWSRLWSPALTLIEIIKIPSQNLNTQRFSNNFSFSPYSVELLADFKQNYLALTTLNTALW